MNNLQIFSSPQFGQVRAELIDNEPYVMLADVCKALDISNVSYTKSRLKEDGVRSTKVIDSLGREQKATFINESNLYRVIFQSRKPNADKFTDWVVEDVLPTIRKHGGYLTNDKIEEVLLNPDTIIQLATQLKQEREEKEKLQQQAEQNKPKVVFAEALEVSKDSILIGELSKLLNQNGIDIGQNRLFRWLRENEYLGKRGEYYNLPTQKAMNLKVFEIKTSIVHSPDGSSKTVRTTKVTGKGQKYFINKFLKEMTA